MTARTDAQAAILQRRQEAGADILHRILEPLPWGAEYRYHVGDHVVLIRSDTMGVVPVGCLGVVIGLEPPDSGMYEKGRFFKVEFDVSQEGIKLSDLIGAEAAKRRNLDPDEPLLAFTESFGPNDLAPWADPTYEVDGEPIFVDGHLQSVDVKIRASYPDDASMLDAVADYIVRTEQRNAQLQLADLIAALHFAINVTLEWV